MPETKSRKKTKGVTIRFDARELREIRRAAKLERRSLNSYVVRAAYGAVSDTLRAQTRATN